jgi:tetratricopeptide (TPR) repeat protein
VTALACPAETTLFGLARPAELSQQLTQDTAALGTPAYMAPEQTGLAAELGEPGPAADIHGLGGLAFALLTGSPPHQAATSTASLQQAARSEITWPAASRRLPRDVRAIVSKCLEREPARRYASAALLAEDLHRFVEALPVRARPASPLRQLARAVRRRPVLAAAISLSAVFAAAAAGGLAYHSATIAAARTQLDRSEQLAEQTAGVAARSMGRLTGDLIEQMILRSRPDDTGHLEFLRQVREEFAGWPLGSDPVEALQFRIKGLNRVARLFADVSHHDDALACLELSLQSLDELAGLQPGDSWGLAERLASLHVQRAFLYQVGRMDEAASSARQSIAVLEAAPADLPDRDRELVRATLDLGMFLSQRQYEEGAAMIEKALSLMRTLREARPDDVSLVAQEAHALFTAQLCAWNAQRLDDCRRQAERLVTEIGGFLPASDTATSAGPLRGFLTQMVSVGCKRLAILAEMTGQADDAITFAQQRQRLCLEAVASLPEGDVESLHKELLDAEIEVAKLLRKTGRGAEAEAALEQAAKTARLLHDEQPGVWDHASLLALVCQQRAELAVARGERDAAARWFQEAITLMEPQLAKPARQRENEAQLAGARAGLHDLGERPDEPRRQTLTSRP